MRRSAVRGARAALLAMAGVGLLGAGQLQAQAWDVPSFLPPRPGDDIGIYISDVGDFGLQGIWRQQGNLNLGLRIGYIDVGRDGAVVAAAESWGLFMTADQELPVDVAWTLGAGAAFNGGTFLEIPVGLTIGRVIQADALTLQVYAHPRVALVFEPDAPEGREETDLEGLFDLGVDAVLNENLKLRLGATLGGTDAVGVGVAYRWTRGAVVR